MNQPTKQEGLVAGSPAVIHLLPEDSTEEMSDLTAAPAANTSKLPSEQFEPGTRWQFIEQGYDWTGASLQTKGYRTVFDSVRETAAPPPVTAPAPILLQDPLLREESLASPVGRLDWRHPDHLGMVAEFVSSLSETAPASAKATASAATVPLQKPAEPGRRPLWHALGLAAAAGGVLALVSFSWGNRELNDEGGIAAQPQPAAVVAALPPAPAVPAEPPQSDSLPSDGPSSLPEVSEDATPAMEAAPAVVNSESVSAPATPVTAPRTRIELETREILVSGRAIAAVVILKRTGNTRGAVRVRWKTVPGSATPGIDYESVSAIVKFADGQAMRTLFVPILQPPARTEPRSFTIQLQRLSKGSSLGAIKSTAVTIWGDT